MSVTCTFLHTLLPNLSSGIVGTGLNSCRVQIRMVGVSKNVHVTDTLPKGPSRFLSELVTPW